MSLSYADVLANIADKSYPAEETIIRFAVNGHWSEVHAQGLAPEDFRLPHCREVFDWCLSNPERTQTEGMPAAFFESKTKAVREMLGEHCVELIPATIPVRYFAKMLRLRSAMERKNEILSQMRNMADADPDDIMAVANQVLAEAAKEKTQNDGKAHVRDSIIRLLDSYEAASKSSGPAGAPTGIESLDRKLGLLRPGQLVTVAARPGNGKSTFATNLAMTSGLAGFRTAYYSFEMGEHEILARMIARRTQIDSKLLLAHNYPELERQGKTEYVGQTMRTIADLPLSIHDKAPKAWETFAAEVQSLAMHEGLKVVVIDMISHLHPRKRSDSRTQELQTITAAAKQLARDSGTCIIGLTQIRRDNTGRNAMPQMDDIKQSGSFEEDSDVLLLLHRPGKTDESYHPNLYQINIAKQRQGETGVLDCYHDFTTSTVRDWHGQDGTKRTEKPSKQARKKI